MLERGKGEGASVAPPPAVRGVRSRTQHYGRQPAVTNGSPTELGERRHRQPAGTNTSGGERPDREDVEVGQGGTAASESPHVLMRCRWGIVLHYVFCWL